MKLTIAVLSDLHATGHPDNNADSSYLRANPNSGDPDLFADLQATIEKGDLSADLVVCPGDICDRGDQVGFTFAWEKLNLITTSLKARELLATCGNHDLDSRYARTEAHEDPDPKGALLQANPSFPFGDTPDTNHYWARNFVIRQPCADVRVLVLNTSAYHGGAQGELEHGRVSSRTIRAISEALRTLPAAKVHILVCHHHLQSLRSWDTRPDGEFVKKGADLLAAISAETGVAWLVIHGHRHIPHVLLSSSPSYVTVGAASFSKIGDRFSNQFHIIELDSDPESPTTPLAGQIHTWNWSRAKKWARYNDPTKGLPPLCGFGYAGGIGYLTSETQAALKGRPFIDWDELLTKIPQLRYLTPEQSGSFRKALTDLGISMLVTEDGLPKQIGVAP